MTKIVPVILAGGSGTRLWPLSNAATPKQFAPLMSKRSMFQDTVARFSDHERFARPIVVCADKHLNLVRRQLAEAGATASAVLVETVGRDSGPAVAIAALHAAQTDPGALLLITPSDHLIDQPTAFQATIFNGAAAAEQGQVVVFGIEAVRPETGYGYIKAGAALPGRHAYAVERFVEKPDRLTAEKYLADGSYYWNSGMVLARASSLISAFEECAPALLAGARNALDSSAHHNGERLLPPAELRRIPAISLDYAVLEHAANIAVTPARFAWSDLGNWAAVSEAARRDDDGNSCIGDVKLLSSNDVYCRSDGLQVAAIGVKDLVIVANGDSVLITHKDQCQRVKEVASA